MLDHSISYNVREPTNNVEPITIDPTVSAAYVTQVLIIPPIYIVFLASVLCCLFNAAFNYILSGRGTVARTIEKWSSVLRLLRHSLIVKQKKDVKTIVTESNGYGEGDGLLDSNTVSTDHVDNALFFQGISNPQSLEETSPVVNASIANEALQNSLQYVRLEAQRMVFVYNPKYMIIATAKSLIMLMIIQYHFDFKGGWDRLVVCCAANLMSGLLTPVLEYGARLLLPLDLDCGRKDLVVEPEEPKDSVLIVEVLVQIGRLELEDLETVLIQCSTFIVFGAVLLPAAVVFCVAGFSAFIWVFSPIWLVYALVRYFYYRSASVGVQASSGRGGDVLFTPAGEFVKAALLKVMTLFLLQWTIQCSFLFGLVLLQGGKYVEALRTEAQNQVFCWYNPMKMNQFQWLCFVSQLFF
ncbi:uncharacterized protein TM35_000052410 [Trypanosoma theileri]|uniref:Uncharacterized protein n=1 Tax=Trypanosoma theileri TaxID=67003 RepID=A0A1X0P3Y2_9TRYP|nr:uncharacterized protein TM35_000052400 [Trypanosoma theileri]XP_028885711.1 uncharacterized protein TM35_000052410 [Trypanosoma theileri]ORC91644.1 hypothetical protein TM35_000052400 [Trypanosoma theileri]ORC91645.1 hypothetical protein TM35_000052410 [Trypanosoma theileri]